MKRDPFFKHISNQIEVEAARKAAQTLPIPDTYKPIASYAIKDGLSKLANIFANVFKKKKK